MKITESKIQLYTITDVGDCGWAEIAIDEGINSGRIFIASDWGSWENYWGYCGKDFKSFLIGLKDNIHYVAEKMRADDYFDFDLTIEKLKKYVLEHRRDDYLDKIQARVIWDDIIKLEKEYCTDKNHFYTLYYNTEFLSDEFNEFEVVYTIKPQFKSFWYKAFIPFLNHLEVELQLQLKDK